MMTESEQQNRTMPSPYHNCLHGAEDEIDLIELILPLWQNKFLIIFITVLTTAVTIAYVFNKTPQYKIIARIKPSDFIPKIKGVRRNFPDAEELKGRVEASVKELYGRRKNGKQPPIIKLTNPGRSRLSVLTLFWPDQKQGKEILTKVLDNINYRALNPGEGKSSILQIQQLKMENSINRAREKIKLAKVKRKKISLQIQEEKARITLADIEAENVKRRIQNLVSRHRMKEKDLTSLQDKLTVVQKAITENKNNDQKLENDTNREIPRRNQLPKTNGYDKTQLLLLSNIVQQNISYMDTIAQKITDLQDEIDRQIPAQKLIIKQKIGGLKLQASLEIDSEITLLEQKIAIIQKRQEQLALIDIVRAPFASLKPAKPNIKKSVVLALVLGLFLGIIAAYSRHFWFLHREKLTSVCLEKGVE